MDYKFCKGDHEVIEFTILMKRGQVNKKTENIKLQDVISK